MGHIESPISSRTAIESDGNAGQSVEEINSTPNDTDDNTNSSNDGPCDDILSASQSPQVPDLPQPRRSTRMRNAPPKLHDYYCNFMMEDKPACWVLKDQEKAFIHEDIVAMPQGQQNNSSQQFYDTTAPSTITIHLPTVSGYPYRMISIRLNSLGHGGDAVKLQAIHIRVGFNLSINHR
nr:hypothetical protein Iba_chr09aCG16640 [Ipomoea batatas]